jgi:hypothetical protein
MKRRRLRLAIGDYLVGGGGLVILVALFALPWYQAPSNIKGALLLMGAGLTANGWQELIWIGPLALLVGLLGLGATYLQQTRASPALPITTTLVLAPLAVLLSVALVVRVFISPPGVQLPASDGGQLQVCVGAYVGLAATLVMATGTWLSLRRDGVDPRDSPEHIETLPLTRPSLSDPA